jgi:hypothetical protein
MIFPVVQTIIWYRKFYLMKLVIVLFIFVLYFPTFYSVFWRFIYVRKIEKVFFTSLTCYRRGIIISIKKALVEIGLFLHDLSNMWRFFEIFEPLIIKIKARYNLGNKNGVFSRCYITLNINSFSVRQTIKCKHKQLREGRMR